VAVLERIEGVEMAGFLRMVPGGRVLPHTDPRDAFLVRAHLGLRLTAEEQAWWEPGTVRLMDTRQSHWNRNLDDVPRFTMIVDVRMPFAIPVGAWGPWRPDAPDVERPAEATGGARERVAG
jgi:aspartyl/asparaginyl beta-hydroxylase (cupin superfamily)